jgi:hypothetical protein
MAVEKIANLAFSNLLAISAFDSYSLGQLSDLRIHKSLSNRGLKKNLIGQIVLLYYRKPLLVLVRNLWRKAALEAATERGIGNIVLSGRLLKAATSTHIGVSLTHIEFGPRHLESIKNRCAKDC